MKAWRIRLAALAAGILLPLVGAAPAANAAAPIPYGAVGPFQIKNIANGRCLDEPWHTYGAPNGTRLQLWDCIWGRNQFNQQWYLLQDRYGRFLLINRHSGRCADALLYGGNGQPVVVWDCYYRFDNANQLWHVYASGPTRPGAIANLNGRVMDADYWRLGSNGTPVQLWDNLGSGQRNQQWYLEYNF